MPNPFEILNATLKDMGINPDECGVLRPEQVAKRPHEEIQVNLAKCGFRDREADMRVVRYLKPPPPPVKPPPAPMKPEPTPVKPKKGFLRGKK